MAADARPIPDKAIDALRRGSKIEAIKLTREATAMGLKESKEAVEAFLAANQDVKAAYDAGRADASTSSLPLLAFVIFVTLAIYWLFFRQ